MRSKFNSMLSDGVVEALWKTMITLATAAGVCVSIISLAAHLNEVSAVRSAGEASVAASLPTTGIGGANVTPSASSLNWLQTSWWWRLRKLRSIATRDKPMKKINTTSRREPFDFDLDNLLHPRGVRTSATCCERSRPDAQREARHPGIVGVRRLRHRGRPELRQAPATAQPVGFVDVMDASARSTGGQASATACRPIIAAWENRIPGTFRRKSNNRGTSGHGQRLN